MILIHCLGEHGGLTLAYTSAAIKYKELLSGWPMGGKVKSYLLGGTRMMQDQERDRKVSDNGKTEAGAQQPDFHGIGWTDVSM